MDYSFGGEGYVCINAPRGPQVVRVDTQTKLSTTHPVSQHDTEDEAIVAAKIIDPSWSKVRLEDL